MEPPNYFVAESQPLTTIFKYFLAKENYGNDSAGICLHYFHCHSADSKECTAKKIIECVYRALMGLASMSTHEGKKYFSHIIDRDVSLLSSSRELLSQITPDELNVLKMLREIHAHCLSHVFNKQQSAFLEETETMPLQESSQAENSAITEDVEIEKGNVFENLNFKRKREPEKYTIRKRAKFKVKTNTLGEMPHLPLDKFYTKFEKHDLKALKNEKAQLKKMVKYLDSVQVESEFKLRRELEYAIIKNIISEKKKIF